MAAEWRLKIMSLYTMTRDLLQRSFGCLGFSVLAHITVIGALFFGPHRPYENVAAASSEGTSTLVELNVEQTSPKPRQISVAPATKKKSAPPPSQPVIPEPEPEFQPSSIVDTEEKNPDIPENLSPVIGDEPVPELAPTAPAPPTETTAVEQPSASQKAPVPAAPAASAATKSNIPAGTVQSVGTGQAINGTALSPSSGTAGTGTIVDASLRRPLSGPTPSYPQRDRILHREGTVVVIGRVRGNGSVDAVSLEHASGSREMDNAALESFRAWRFMPGPEATVRKAFKFKLQGAEKMGYSRLSQSSTGQ